MRWLTRASWSDAFEGILRRLVFGPEQAERPPDPAALRQARHGLVRFGTAFFGEPTKEHRAAIERIESLPCLYCLHERTLDVDTWDALLAE
jgi:hypothetical protein